MNIALVGKPNSGKSALFNALTGARQKVANYPGVTVEKREGVLRLNEAQSANIIDLPGAYSLQPTSQDERITCDMLNGKIAGTPQPDLVICIAEATNLRMSLPIVLDVLSLGLPMILVLNKIDNANRLGYHISVDKLKEALGIPVIALAATKTSDARRLIDLIKDEKRITKPANHQDYSIGDHAEKIKALLETAILQKGRRDIVSERLDKLLLHPIFGLVAFLLIIAMVFQAVFNLAALPMDMVDAGIAGLINIVNDTLPPSAFQSLIGDGILAGVGSVIIFIPQIIFLFFFILILEDSGYMARAAFLLDRFMRKVGLEGKSFIPLFSSFACAIPGIMATRTIESSRDRIVTILIAPLMTCSARLPVYALIISAFIPNQQVFGFIKLQGLVLFGLYLSGIVSAMLVAFVMRWAIIKAKPSPFLLEMPDYQWPNLRNLSLGLLERAKIFMFRAGKVILPLMIIIWFLASYPSAPTDATGPAILYSFAGMIGQFIAPIFEPLGFNWQMVVALIPGMAAREVAVGVLGTVYALSSDVDIDRLGAILSASWSLPTALSFLTWYIFAPQCLPTFAIAKRETNGWLWPSVMFGYLFALAYLCSFLIYNISLLIFT